MSIKRFLAFLFAILLLAGPAWGTAGFTDCSGPPGVTLKVSQVNGFARYCWEYLLADGATESPIFEFRGFSMQVCFDPDVDDATDVPASSSVATLLHCPTGIKNATSGDRSCQPVRALAGLGLTGLSGTSATQNRCVRVGPGWYYISTTVTVAAHEPIVTLQGEK